MEKFVQRNMSSFQFICVGGFGAGTPAVQAVSQ